MEENISEILSIMKNDGVSQEFQDKFLYQFLWLSDPVKDRLNTVEDALNQARSMIMEYYTTVGKDSTHISSALLKGGFT